MYNAERDKPYCSSLAGISKIYNEDRWYALMLFNSTGIFAIVGNGFIEEGSDGGILLLDRSVDEIISRVADHRGNTFDQLSDFIDTLLDAIEVEFLGRAFLQIIQLVDLSEESGFLITGGSESILGLNFEIFLEVSFFDKIDHFLGAIVKRGKHIMQRVEQYLKGLFVLLRNPPLRIILGYPVADLYNFFLHSRKNLNDIAYFTVDILRAFLDTSIASHIVARSDCSCCTLHHLHPSHVSFSENFNDLVRHLHGVLIMLLIECRHLLSM
ncbi:hypothetical protein PMAYCL1PPCAC_19600 [Pristionchus mayeri]|uniref:Uncharacterized protein n=1 Tax=Pristionchus mayeri TaxID=1317129 RepID=A0AAN5CS38_9BILA|nr:hypothetical protein PMAYCL1PPCAC_19600 [Pristionchus mayeri]